MSLPLKVAVARVMILVGLGIGLRWERDCAACIENEMCTVLWVCGTNGVGFVFGKETEVALLYAAHDVDKTLAWMMRNLGSTFWWICQ